MKNHWLALVFVLTTFGFVLPGNISKQQDKIVIAFGSCNNQGLEQILWDDILDERPDLWIWLGDNIYGDTEDMTVLNNKYEKQKSHPLYQKLMQNSTIIGVWDDHDYGVNNGGKQYKMKAQSQQALLDFLDVPVNDPRRFREGAYSSYDLDKSGVKVKVILLDSRYFRDKPRTFFNLLPNYNGDMLGEEQWLWLEKELRESEADIHIIGNGTQIIPNRHKYEKWANFPNERKRLFNLISKMDLKNPILISGDRHFAEMSKINWDGKCIYEITSSGLTHSSSRKRQPKNQYRIDSVVNIENYGIIEITKTDEILIKGKVVSDNRVVRIEENFY